jgi:arsenate reductase (thioredoxin)
VTLRPIECRIYSRLLQAADSGSRSQMAAAFFNQLADRTKAEAISAGTEPGLRAHPEVLAAMQEIGIDLSDATPQRLTQELANDAALLITMGCGDKCPYVSGVRRDDWALSDPKGRPMDEVRAVRDDIKARVAGLIQAEGLEMEATWLFAQLRQTTIKKLFPAANIRDVDPFTAIWPQQCVPSVRETYRIRGGLRPVTNRPSPLNESHQVCQSSGLPILPYFLPTYSTTPRSSTGRS